MTTIDQSDELLVGFIDESIDSLQDLPGLLEDQRRDAASGAINPVFRSIHSIKGNAGFFGLAAIKQFSHALENTLDEIRNGKVALSAELQRAFVEGFDMLDEMLQQVLSGETSAELRPQDKELLDRVGELANQSRTETSEEELLLAEALSLAEEIAAAGVAQSAVWAERVRNLIPANDAAAASGQSGEEPAVAACRPEQLVGVACVLAGHDVGQRIKPLLDLFLAMQEKAYCKEIGQQFLDGAAELAGWAKSVGQEVFAAAVEGAAGDFRTIFESPLDVDPTLAGIVWDRLEPQFARLLPAAGVSANTAGASESAAGSSESAAGASVNVADAEDAATPNDEEEPASPEAAGKKGGAAKGAAKNRLLRVREDRVDEFMDDVSGLFITCERLKDLQRRMFLNERLDDLVDELRQINHALAQQTNDLQTSVVGLRKVPVRGLFSKFPRVARSLAGNLGKQLDVHLIGEEIEIDKSLVEDLDAPMMHMVRNTCDHGIETPEERLAQGKSEAGNLWLKCDLTRTHVVITIQDDGRGIDPERLKRKAIEKGVLNEQQVERLTKEETLELIFHPGFSTAEQVSDVSGRGVGMDVVRTKLREHDADVKIESHLGVGTTMTLEIPVRQAVLVIDGLLLASGGEQFVVPFEHIREILDLDSDQLKTVQGEPVASIRGEPFAAVDVGRLLDTNSQLPSDGTPIPGVLIGCKTGSVCLLVDRVLGQRKVVVNNLNGILQGNDKIAGVAQLGGGRLALVLSGPDLVKASRDLCERAAQAV